ncbi:hypothetical protein KKD62_01845 [Patescibacteria group bacterium]|nr:hypothetical protein [Patescibacteria group bacterium]MBU1931094.1 hypothetical protein [Patescibacteria group bacterium]
MIKLKKRADYLTLAILSVIMVFTWTGVSVYLTLTKPAKIKVSKKQLAPLQSKFDLETLETLNQRLIISQAELTAFEEQKTRPTVEHQMPEASPTAIESTEAAELTP